MFFKNWILAPTVQLRFSKPATALCVVKCALVKRVSFGGVRLLQLHTHRRCTQADAWCLIEVTPSGRNASVNISYPNPEYLSCARMCFGFKGYRYYSRNTVPSGFEKNLLLSKRCYLLSTTARICFLHEVSAPCCMFMKCAFCRLFGAIWLVSHFKISPFYLS